MYVIIEVIEVDRTGEGYLLPKKAIGPFESRLTALKTLKSLQAAHRDDPLDFTILRCTATDQY
jgi:hypothetical protein